MSASKNSSNNSNNKPFQLPLKGFHVPADVKVDGYVVTHEGMGDGRIRTWFVKKPVK